MATKRLTAPTFPLQWVRGVLHGAGFRAAQWVGDRRSGEAFLALVKTTYRVLLTRGRIHMPRADHLKPSRDFLAERHALFHRAS